MSLLKGFPPSLPISLVTRKSDSSGPLFFRFKVAHNISMRNDMHAVSLFFSEACMLEKKYRRSLLRWTQKSPVGGKGWRRVCVCRLHTRPPAAFTPFQTCPPPASR